MQSLLTYVWSIDEQIVLVTCEFTFNYSLFVDLQSQNIYSEINTFLTISLVFNLEIKKMI